MLRNIAKRFGRILLINSAILWVVFMMMFSAYTGVPERGMLPPEKSPSVKMLEQHINDCWTNGQPALADVPTHVIVTLKTGEVLYTDAYVGQALDYVFENADNEIYDVHAFCR